MATTAVTRGKKTNAKVRDLARQLSDDIGRRAERLPARERKERHAKLLEIANRVPK